jgi:hypothetical protein
VPDSLKTEELTDLIEWLGEVVRQTDSSLLDEWEQLTDPDADGLIGEALRPAREVDQPRPITANVKAFRVLVRNAMFRRVELASRGRWDELGALDAAHGWDADRWEEAVEAYFADHDEIGTGPQARGPQLFQVEQEPGRWLVRQAIDDPAGDHDWAITAEVDLAASDEAGEPVVRVSGFDRL